MHFPLRLIPQGIFCLETIVVINCQYEIYMNSERGPSSQKHFPVFL